jgi:molybdopterin synthase sulfur carrier subunit
MAVRLLFLGKLADLAGEGERVLALAGPLGWDALLDLVEPALASALAGAKVRVARNGSMVADKTALVAGEGDEIAFLPPVSGG